MVLVTSRNSWETPCWMRKMAWLAGVRVSIQRKFSRLSMPTVMPTYTPPPETDTITTREEGLCVGVGVLALPPSPQLVRCRAARRPQPGTAGTAPPNYHTPHPQYDKDMLGIKHSGGRPCGSSGPPAYTSGGRGLPDAVNHVHLDLHQPRTRTLHRRRRHRDDTLHTHTQPGRRKFQCKSVHCSRFPIACPVYGPRTSTHPSQPCHLLAQPRKLDCLMV